MTNVERRLFWEKLCSLPNEEAASDLAQLKKMVSLPPAIFRYRKVSEKNLDALETNKMFFSTADHFDDPFDTYINIDYDLIRNQIDEGMSDPERFIFSFMERWKSTGLPLPAQSILEEFKKCIYENAEKYKQHFFEILKQEVQVAFQQRIYSVCFCESPLNQSMWIKYGAENRGFCLMYSLKESESNRLKCGSDPICEQCNVRLYGLELFPVYYSKEKFDATSTAFEIMQGYSQCLVKGIQPLSIKDIALWWDFSKWSLEKVALIKSIEHEHDEEWRLLFTGHTTNRIQCEWVPSAIILGLRMSDEDKVKVKAAAKKAGIPNCYSVIINLKNELELIEDCDFDNSLVLFE